MWYTAEYSVIPSAIDTNSSNVYVYVRKNITRTERQRDEVTEVVYVCDEQKILKNDWDLYQKLTNHDTELVEVQDALIELAEIIGG